MRELDTDTLVIADADGPSGIAGVMGGADSEITDEATEVVLEAASFDRSSILRTTRRLGIRTEASNRFEKGVDPELAPVANREAARLLIELTGATLAPAPLDVRGELARARLDRAARRARAAPSRASTSVADESAAILERLGFAVEREGAALRVQPPTWRALDVTREIDVVEEVARIHGLEHVPATLPAGARSGGLSTSQLIRRRLHEALLGSRLHRGADDEPRARRRGARALAERGRPALHAGALMNPLSAEHAALRTMLLPSLAAVVARNQSLGRPDVSIYEIAHVYRPRPGETLPDEPWTLGALLAGRDVSFFTAKGVLETVLGAVGVRLEVEPGAGRDPFLHPGRAARILVGGHDIGYLGELHPSLAERLGISGTAAAFELEIRPLELHVPGPAIAVAVPDTPPLRQDIAVVVSDDHLAGDVVAVARASGGELLRDVSIFDVYRDARALGEGRPLARAAADVPGGRPHADGRRGRPAARADHRGARSALRGRAALTANERLAEPPLHVVRGARVGRVREQRGRRPELDEHAGAEPARAGASEKNAVASATRAACCMLCVTTTRV